LEMLHGALRGLVARDPEIRGMEDQVLDHVESAVGIGTLWHDTDAAANADGIVDDIGAGDTRTTGTCKDARGEDTDRRRLARAVGAEEPEELPLPYLEIEALERDEFARTAGHRRHLSGTGRRTECWRTAAPTRRSDRIDFSQTFSGYRWHGG